MVEDFAPFHVTVTTRQPPIDDLLRTDEGDVRWGVRVAIGGSSSDWYTGNASGVAKRSTFAGNLVADQPPVYESLYDIPCFVFPNGLNAKEVAETASHEVGHTLGLAHDGRTDPSEDYYAGHGTWAPIMGDSFGKPITQWSRGEYTETIRKMISPS